MSSGGRPPVPGDDPAAVSCGAAAGGGADGYNKGGEWCGGAFRPSARRVRRCSEQQLLPCCVRNYWYFLSTVPF